MKAPLHSALNLALFGLALCALDRVLRAYPAADIVRALRAVPVRALLLSIAITLLGYLALVAYDVVALRFVGPRLPLRRMLVPSFISFAVSNNAPASMVTAGGVRYRLYQPHGLTPLAAAAVAGLNIVTYALGLSALAGIALLFDPMVGRAPASRVASSVFSSSRVPPLTCSPLALSVGLFACVVGRSASHLCGSPLRSSAYPWRTGCCPPGPCMCCWPA